VLWGRVVTDERIRNVTAGETCNACLDMGLVEVGTEPRASVALVDGEWTKRIGEQDVWGPCPRCELGHAIEFPAKTFGPWGRLGFWRGRSPLSLGVAA
jgi:hypothetical protein